MSSWRKYNGQQWLRLGVAIASPPSVHGDFVAIRMALMPLTIAAAFLLGPQELGSSSSAASNPEEIEMKRMMSMAIVLGTASALHAQELLVNGSLEGRSGAAACTWDNPSTGSTMIPGWTVSGPWNVDWVYYAAPCAQICPRDGSRYVDLNGSLIVTAPASAIAQTVGTVTGLRYRFSVFAMCNSVYSTVGEFKTLRVSVDQSITEFALLIVSNTADCPSPLWEEIVVCFTALGPKTTIELRSMFPDNAGGIFVDAATLSVIECAMDIDQSATVDALDLALVLQHWGLVSPEYPQADIDGDGNVGAADLTLVLSHWGPCP